MRVVRNIGTIKARQRVSRLLLVAGLLCLFGSIVMTLYPQLLIGAYIVLIAGFLSFNAGMQSWAKWNHRPRPDELLDSTLRRFNDRYTLIHYPNISGRFPPEHILVWPGGLLVITTRELAGRIQVNGKRWRRIDNLLLRIFTFGGPPLGNPTVECLGQQEALKAFLEQQDLPGADAIDGLIVFVNDRVELQVIESELTVVTRKELPDAVRALGNERRLHGKEIEEIIVALSQGEAVEGPIALPTRIAEEKKARTA